MVDALLVVGVGVYLDADALIYLADYDTSERGINRQLVGFE